MKRSDLTLNVILLIVDYIMVVLGGIVAYYLRFGTSVTSIKPVVYELPFRNFLYIMLLGSVFVVLVFAWQKLYSVKSYWRLRREIGKVIIGCSSVILITIILIFFNRELFSSRFIILFTWIFSILFVSSGRICIHIVQNILFRTGISGNNLIIVGSGKTTYDILDRIQSNHSYGYRIIRHYQDTNGDLISKLHDTAKSVRIDEVLQTNPDLPKKDTLSLLEYCNDHGIIFRYAADLYNTKVRNIEVDMLAGIPLIEIKRTSLDGWGRIAKRLFDIVGSAVLIALTSPIMLFSAIAIKLDSKGPVFISRLPDGTLMKRVGIHGKLFHYFKFRSMIDGAHQLRYDPEFLKNVKNLREGTPMMKFVNDPRITRVGRFLRRFSLDEFPEFFLVFLGRMSLVGPRPHLPEEVERYQKHHRKALSIKPGITGLAQIFGRSDLNFDEEIRLDTYYIENWSLGMDLWILLRTPFCLSKKRKAL